MSDSWISWKPRIDEPSNPNPSSNDSSVSSEVGTEKCCISPGRSAKRRSMIWTPRSLIKLRTSPTESVTRDASFVSGGNCPGLAEVRGRR
jgi:hypothetical protein